MSSARDESVPALAERIFFFHPLVHLASREYALAREAACDATVMDTLDAAPRSTVGCCWRSGIG